MGDSRFSTMLKWTRILFFVNGVVWLVFGALSFMLAMKSTSDLRLILSWLMLANAIVMICFGIIIVSGRPWVFFLGIVYMTVNVVLSVTDQFGWVDALILLLNLCLLGMLFVTRHRIIQAAKTTSGGA